MSFPTPPLSDAGNATYVRSDGSWLAAWLLDRYNQHPRAPEVCRKDETRNVDHSRNGHTEYLDQNDAQLMLTPGGYGHSNHRSVPVLDPPSTSSTESPPEPSRHPPYIHSTADMEKPCSRPHKYFGEEGSYDTTPYSQSPQENWVEACTRRQLLGLLASSPSPSPRYRGNPDIRMNQSADIPDAFNTSVWVTNLPADVDHKTLLGSVRDCGKIYAAVINGPAGNHATAASKLVFFEASGAEALLRQAREGRFVVGGRIPWVCRNRIKTAARPPSPHSRVLHIEGPPEIVNHEHLAAWFRAHGIIWQDEDVVTLSHPDDAVARLEWRFGSYRCQAESARHVIETMKKNPAAAVAGPWEDSRMPWHAVMVNFGVDPCAPNTVAQYVSAPSPLLPGCGTLNAGYYVDEGTRSGQW